MIFAISSQFAGAVATSEFLLYFDYFARKEWGDEYYKYFDKKYKSTAQGPKTIQQQIHQYFQQIGNGCLPKMNSYQREKRLMLMRIFCV